MTQLTIELTDKEYKRIKKTAKKLGKPIEDLICEIISRFTETEVKVDITKDPLYQFDGFDFDAPSDLSINVDKYLLNKCDFQLY
ncbi:MAG: hypothetical protein ACE5HI_15905 [bacterium]